MNFYSLVGAPYAFPSEPPKTFDCWTLVKYVRRELGLPCPLPYSDQEPWCVPENLAKGVSRARQCWRTLAAPLRGSMAVMEPGHVGVFIDDGVLHALCRSSSVVWTSYSAVRRVWPNTEFWEAK